MIVEKVLIKQYEYVIHINKDEALFLRELVNLSPSTIKKLLDDKYSLKRIADLKNIENESMWKTLSDALEQGD